MVKLGKDEISSRRLGIEVPMRHSFVVNTVESFSKSEPSGPSGGTGEGRLSAVPE